jgi:asparagine synthase (glutamine-hydrolysing)
MCGIWTLFDLKNHKICIEDYIKYIYSIRNRGPDYSGIHEYKNSIISFHRLSIINNSVYGNQPFVKQLGDKYYVLVCNGEIYNFRNLYEYKNRESFLKGDCYSILEIFLNCSTIDQFIHMLKNKVHGEYAFVISEYDIASNELTRVIVARDIIGVRPLYYSFIEPENKSSIVICSELKGVPKNYHVATEFPPGNVIVLNVSSAHDQFNIDTHSFQWIYDVKPLISPNHSLYIDKIRNSVIASITRRLDPDLEDNYAFLLSGGVDSSIVCAVAANIFKNKKIKTFCCGFAEGTDIQYARKVAKHIQSEHHEVIFTHNEALEAIENTIRCIESWDTTTIRASVAQYLISKYIKQNTNCKIIMVGEGPDEICSSYLFNWYAPSPEKLHECAMEYVKNIHYYDAKRADKCISFWGLEARVPLLDPEFIKSYWEIPSEFRHPKYKNIEKWWLRKAFDFSNLLPQEVLWRKKEAFSDGISSNKNSWFNIINKNVELMYKKEKKYAHALNIHVNEIPPTQEAMFYRKIFEKYYQSSNVGIIPKYWTPKWDENGNTIEKYIDPSARILSVYSKT